MLHTVLLLLPCATEASAAPYVWGGIFATPGAYYTWDMQAAQLVTPGNYIGHPAGPTYVFAYKAASMKIVFLPAPAATDAALKALEPSALNSFAQTCTNVASGGTITPTEGACFTLIFAVEGPSDENGPLSTTFTIDTASATDLAVFSDQKPYEFERNSPFFGDGTDAGVDPAATVPVPLSSECSPRGSKCQSLWDDCCACDASIGMLECGWEEPAPCRDGFVSRFVSGPAGCIYECIPLGACNRVFVNSAALRVAVNLWIAAQDTAEAQYGHISSWDVRSVTDMSVRRRLLPRSVK